MKVRAKISLYPHQYEYVTSKHPRCSIIGGYGSGKTYANIQRTMYLLKLRQGKAYIFYAAPTYDLIFSTYYPDLINTLDSYCIKYHEDKQHHTIIIDTPELHGTIKLISLEKYKNLIGFTATDGILDEFDVIAVNRQREIWTRALARLRGCDNGTLSITSTPEGHKLCYELHKAGTIKQITASTTDNKSLPASFIDDMMLCYDEAHVAMYLNGQYMNLAGLRAMYNYREHDIIPPVDTDSIPINLTVGMDFNVDPFCLTVSYMKPAKYENGIMIERERKITFDEFYIHNAGGCDGYGSFTDKAMMLLLQRYPNQWYKSNIDNTVEKVYNIDIRPDMTGKHRSTSSNITDLTILKKYGCTISGTVNPPVSSRLKIANIALQKKLWSVTSNCVNLIKDMEMCVTDEHGDLLKDNTVSKDRTHMLDAVTYDVFQEYREELFKKPQGNRI